MTDELAEVRRLQKEVVKALETGKDPAPILKELAELRAKIAMEAEREELQKIADQRQKLRDKAEAVKLKVQKQGEAIDAFLKARGAITEALAPIVDKARELPGLQEACYGGFHDIQQFGWTVRGIPFDYLGKDFGCPMLEMEGGLVSADNKAIEAVSYLIAAHGCLAGLKKGQSRLPLKKAEGLLENEPETEAGGCIVCSHAEIETINNLLRQGKSLRDIESQFDVSRSTLSRHKNRCLNLGAIRIAE